MNCITPIDESNYTAPTLSYEEWSFAKLQSLIDIISSKLDRQEEPTVIVMEISHFTLPIDAENREWAEQNMRFANELCQAIIKKYRRKFKIIPTILLNNLDEDNDIESERFIDELVEGQKYIRKDSLRIISERNMKNRAFKALKKRSDLVDSFITIDGKAYLKDDEYKHDLAAGFVNDDGKIIPRCGLILTSFLDTIAKFANDRLHRKSGTHVLFVSFSEEPYEYQRVKLGVDIYSRTHKNVTIHPIIMHWAYRIDQSLTSYREADSQDWKEIEL